MKTSQKGINLIKEFEGLELTAYRCAAGVLTIGYGHTGRDVRSGLTITEQEAEELLVKDLAIFEDAVNDLVKVPVTQSIFDALVSFTFNVGEGAFSTSTLLRKLNQRKYAEALDQLLRWDKAGTVKLPGLTRRREAERKLGYSEPFPKL